MASKLAANIEPIPIEAILAKPPSLNIAPTVVESTAPQVPTPAKPPVPETITASRSRASKGPVSTGSPNDPKAQVIVLTTGGKVEADQVWRTKDGVWYRKNGIVTLLKKNRVKAIVNR
jgi:hypothetical protein